ncbi:MAG: hypothetical protein RML45_06255 [Acetobacteraceae bacterium]|nr:hypothetical protein [Acetobacteraceae bacterium]
MTAASKALPPFSSTPIATAEAIQWVEAHMPKLPRSSGRVVNSGDQAVITAPFQLGSRR